MARFEDTEVWRQIPPEEKLEMMARAHSHGLMTAVGVILVGCTCAISFQTVSLMWGSILISPIIFQVAAGRAWRGLKPRSILRYLAARSAARRYAYSAQSEDLTLDLIFQGTIEQVVDPGDAEAMLEAAAKNIQETEAWITLFRDTVVIMSERAGGAKQELVHPIDHRLLIQSRSDDGKDYSTSKEVYLTTVQQIIDPLGESEVKTHYRLTSRSPGALVVFEKKLQELKQQRELDALKRSQIIAPVETTEDPYDSFDDFQTTLM